MIKKQKKNKTKYVQRSPSVVPRALPFYENRIKKKNKTLSMWFSKVNKKPLDKNNTK